MKKRRYKRRSDSKLVEKCNKLTGLECAPPEWEDHADLSKSIPDEGVVALIVDVDRSEGSVQFFTVSDDEYVDMVGQDGKGQVIVSWREGLQYVCFGACRVGKVRQLSSSTTEEVLS
ncbi:hypothetical protein V2G26_007759 [Clonostachys chloroleuca]